MKRTALSCAAIFTVCCAFLYFFGIKAVFFMGILLCFLAVAAVVLNSRLRLGIRPAVTLLLCAAFCLYLILFYGLNILNTQMLAGQRHIVTCRVVEEPKFYTGYTVLTVKTDGNNAFDKGFRPNLGIELFIPDTSPAAIAKEGDILSADVLFSGIQQINRKFKYPNDVFIAAYCKDAEITGHKESLYTYLIDVRRSVRESIDAYSDGDNAAVLKGLVLGDVSDMSEELYSKFKACGVAHITAVSGMHIGAFCMMLVTLLSSVLGRRRASAVTLIPLLFIVMIAGATPSSVRAGIMCALILFGNIFLKKTDGLNSLGLAVSVMLIINPYYILSLSFRLSCAAALGVIAVTSFGNTVSQRLIRFEKKYITSVLREVIVVFVQSIGAVLCTLPFQIIEFGHVSLVSPLASVAVCSAAVFAMTLCVVGTVLHYIPLIHYVAFVPYFASVLFADYIRVVVMLLSDIPFSYIPFGKHAAILWTGLSLALGAIWMFLDRPYGKKAVVLMVSFLLLISLWSEHIASRSVVEIAVLDTNGGFCTVVSLNDKCVIIGCGDDYSDCYVLRTHLRSRGIDNVEALLIPNDSTAVFGGYGAVLKESDPKYTVVSDSFPDTVMLDGNIKEYADGVQAGYLNGKLEVKTFSDEGYCVYTLKIYNKVVVVGVGAFDVESLGIERVDYAVVSRVLPKRLNASVTVISGSADPNYVENLLKGRVIAADGKNISLKLKNGKGMTLYAG